VESKLGRGVGPWLTILAVAVLVSACSPPIRVKRVDSQRAFRVMLQNEITTGELSRYTRNLLFDHDLGERYEKDPAGALAELHAAVVAGEEQREGLVSIAELNFHYAEHGGGRPYYFAAAAYAWAYLFPDEPARRPDRFNPRLRVACDLYNRALTQALKDGKNVAPRGGQGALPFGTLEIAFDPAELHWSIHELTDFVPTAELEVEGLPTYHRWGGIGAPFAAGVKPPTNDSRGKNGPGTSSGAGCAFR